MTGVQTCALPILEKVHKAGARFDFEKAKWFNHQYLKNRPDEELALAIKPMVEAKGYTFDLTFTTGFCRLMKERAVYLNDLLEQGYYFFVDIHTYDLDTLKKKYNSEKRGIFDKITAAIEATTDQTPTGFDHSVKEVLTANGLKPGEVMPVLRLALAGTMQGPAVFDMIALLGKEKTVARLKKSFDYFDTVK